MSEVLQGLEGLDLASLTPGAVQAILAYAKQKAETDSAMRVAVEAEGVKVKTPTVHSSLVNLRNKLKKDIEVFVSNMDASDLAAVRASTPGVKLVFGLSFTTDQTKVFHSEARRIAGGAGKDKIWVDTETGKLYPSQVAYLKDKGTQLANVVIRRQIKEIEAPLKKAVLTNGRPTHWYDRHEKDNDYKGEPISDAALAKINAAGSVVETEEDEEDEN